VVGEVKEVPYVRESPIKRERREAMFRGYAKYIAGLREKEKAAENVGSGTLDTVVSTKPGTTPMGPGNRKTGIRILELRTRFDFFRFLDQPFSFFELLKNEMS